MTLPNTDRLAQRFVDAAYWEERYMVAISQYGSMKFWDLSMKPIITESPKWVQGPPYACPVYSKSDHEATMFLARSGHNGPMVIEL